MVRVLWRAGREGDEVRKGASGEEGSFQRGEGGDRCYQADAIKEERGQLRFRRSRVKRGNGGILHGYGGMCEVV